MDASGHVLLGQGFHDSAITIEVAAHDFLENIFGDPGQAGVIKERAAPIQPGIENVAGSIVNAGVGEETGAGGGEFRSTNASAQLVLPASAGGQGLLQAQYIVE